MLEGYKLRAQIAKGLAHPARLMIVDILQSGEMSVSEITLEVGLDQSTISKHLAILKQAGLVQGRKEGNRVFYSSICSCLEDMFTCFESILSQNFERLKKQRSKKTKFSSKKNR